MNENPEHSSHSPHGGQKHDTSTSQSSGGQKKIVGRGHGHGFVHRVVGPFAKKHKLLFVTIIAFIGVALIFGSMKIAEKFFGEKKGPEKTGPETGTLAVNVVELKAEHFVDPMVAVGTIQGGKEIPLRFEVDGIIEVFDYSVGNRVRKGEVIARLNQRDTFLKLKKARLDLGTGRFRSRHVAKPLLLCPDWGKDPQHGDFEEDI